jgi:hypothetical protein
LRGGNRAAFVLASLVTVLAGTTLSAHRRDEYLQAARLAVEPRRVELEIDLTPGIAIAEGIIGTVDRDRDGTVSRAEQQAYVEDVIEAIELRVDGRVLHLEHVGFTFPGLDAVRSGEGTIRLRAAAHLPRLSEGNHELAFRNRHRPDVSVYLANALIPNGDSIAITAQRRDAAQRELTIAYSVRNQDAVMTPIWLLGLLGTVLLATFGDTRLRAAVIQFARR